MLPIFLLFAAGPLYLDTECPNSAKPSFIAHPTDCSLYYECIQGKKYEGSCPDGLFWNDQKEYCDLAQNVRCDSSNDPSCPSKETSYIVYPGDCQKYYLCTDGQKEERSCPENMFFNPKTNSCGYEDEVDCSYTPTSTQSTASTASTTPPPTTVTTAATTTTVTSSTIDPICPSTHGTSYVVYPDDCSKYYKCTDGYSTLLECPENLVFNPETNTCDYSDNVSCDSTHGPTSGTTTTTASPSTTPTTALPTTTFNPHKACEDQPDGTFIADPSDCTKYYECVYGDSKSFSCPYDTMWDQSVTACVKADDHCK